MKIYKEDIRKLVPNESGIYFLYNKRDKLVYIGKAANLKNRLSSRKYISYWSPEDFKPFHYCNFILVEEDKLLRVEKVLIDFYKPRYNNMTVIKKENYFKYNVVLPSDQDLVDLMWKDSTKNLVDKMWG